MRWAALVLLVTLGVVVALLALDVDHGAAAQVTAPPFDGCFGRGESVDGHMRWYVECENTEGLWKCDKPMARETCVWDGPLPSGHPLRHAEGSDRVVSN